MCLYWSAHDTRNDYADVVSGFILCKTTKQLSMDEHCLYVWDKLTDTLLKLIKCSRTKC